MRDRNKETRKQKKETSKQINKEQEIYETSKLRNNKATREKATIEPCNKGTRSANALL